MYLVRINPPINYTFSDDSVFLKKILAGDINSLNLLVILAGNDDMHESSKEFEIRESLISLPKLVIESATVHRF